jgi:purine nucleosidase
MTIPLILDTDIGTDVDDLFALALLLNSPEIDLKGVCCVYADVSIRARMVLKLLALRGREDIPVRMGTRQPLLKIQPVYWIGHEGKALLAGEIDAPLPEDILHEHAADFLIRTVQENPNTIHLLCIGPLTNLALALIKAPEIAHQVKHITIMGGVLRGKDHLATSYVEHNIRCDPEAAHIVFTSGAPITLIPLDVTEQVRLTKKDLQAMQARGDAFRNALADELEVWFGHISHHDPTRDFTYMHDPLAAASIIQPDLVKTVPVHLDVELHGRYAAGATLMHSPGVTFPANVEVALAVNASAFEKMLLSRILE